MAETSAISKTAGRFGLLLVLIGVATFMISLTGYVPRVLLFISLAMMAVSLVLFAYEEFGPRRS
jgi:hypothetical protein